MYKEKKGKKLHPNYCFKLLQSFSLVKDFSQDYFNIGSQPGAQDPLMGHKINQNISDKS